MAETCAKVRPADGGQETDVAQSHPQPWSMSSLSFKFENMAAAVVALSRDTLDWAAQQESRRRRSRSRLRGNQSSNLRCLARASGRRSESRAFSKLVNFDPKAASWKDWAFKFENMAAAVVPSSRDTLDWAAQQDTPILNVDDVEAGPDSVEIHPQVYVALAELLEGEALDIVQNTTRGAGLEACFTHRQWDGNGRCWAASSILEQ